MAVDTLVYRRTGAAFQKLIDGRIAIEAFAARNSNAASDG